MVAISVLHHQVYIKPLQSDSQNCICDLDAHFCKAFRDHSLSISIFKIDQCRESCLCICGYEAYFQESFWLMSSTYINTASTFEEKNQFKSNLEVSTTQFTRRLENNQIMSKPDYISCSSNSFFLISQVPPAPPNAGGRCGILYLYVRGFLPTWSVVRIPGSRLYRRHWMFE